MSRSAKVMTRALSIACSLTGGGPQLVITDLGVLRPDPGTMELALTGIYPGISVDQVRESTGWDLAISAGLSEIAPPSEAELTALRDLLAGGSPSRTANADGPASARRPAMPVINAVPVAKGVPT